MKKDVEFSIPLSDKDFKKISKAITTSLHPWQKVADRMKEQMSCKHIYGYDDFTLGSAIIVRNSSMAGMIAKDIDDEHNFKVCPKCGKDLIDLCIENRKRMGNG